MNYMCMFGVVRRYVGKKNMCKFDKRNTVLFASYVYFICIFTWHFICIYILYVYFICNTVKFLCRCFASYIYCTYVSFVYPPVNNGVGQKVLFFFFSVQSCNCYTYQSYLEYVLTCTWRFSKYIGSLKPREICRSGSIFFISLP